MAMHGVGIGGAKAVHGADDERSGGNAANREDGNPVVMEQVGVDDIGFERKNMPPQDSDIFNNGDGVHAAIQMESLKDGNPQSADVFFERASAFKTSKNIAAERLLMKSKVGHGLGDACPSFG